MNKQILFTSLTLILIIILFDLTNIDISVQEYFYNFDRSSWILNAQETIPKFLFYNGIKKLLIFFAFIILFCLVFFKRKKLITEYSKGLYIVLLSAIAVPLVVGFLKAETNMPCPKNMEYFNGNYPDVKLFQSYPKEFIEEKKIKCWPAGHASAGFALFSLFFLFKKRINQIYAFSFAFTIGWSMGIYKMLIGDHFLSHTIITMLIAWLIVLIVNKIVNLIHKKENIEKST